MPRSAISWSLRSRSRFRAVISRSATNSRAAASSRGGLVFTKTPFHTLTKYWPKKGLVEFRKGSGFFAKKIDFAGRQFDLETLTAHFLHEASQFGDSLEEIRKIFLEQLQRKQSHGFVVLEEDDDLRDILIYEVSLCTGERVTGMTPADLNKDSRVSGKMVALADEKRKIERSIADCLYLKSRSIPEAMVGRKRPEEDSLIALVSGWDGFLEMAQTILLAVEIDPDSILTRSTHTENWEHGLSAASMLITDSLAARSFGDDPRLRVFPFLSDESISELRKLAAG